MNDLNSVKAGDTVVVSTRFGKSLEQVIRTTATMIMVGHTRFRKESGWEVGGDIWNSKSIRIPSEKDISEIEIKEKRRKLKEGIEAANLDSRSLATLEAVHSLLYSKL